MRRMAPTIKTTTTLKRGKGQEMEGGVGEEPWSFSLRQGLSEGSFDLGRERLGVPMNKEEEVRKRQGAGEKKGHEMVEGE